MTCPRSSTLIGVNIHLCYRYRVTMSTKLTVKPKDRCDMCEREKLRTVSGPEEAERFLNTFVEKLKHTMKETKTEVIAISALFVLIWKTYLHYLLPMSLTFFYKRKLNVYHLTAHCSTSKQSYGALWSETMSVRTRRQKEKAIRNKRDSQ